MTNEQCEQMATEMRNLQTNIHDGEYEICAILECLYDWELRLFDSANGKFVRRPIWWKRRHAFEDCNTGFCRHCGWKNPPRAIHREPNGRVDRNRRRGA